MKRLVIWIGYTQQQQQQNGTTYAITISGSTLNRSMAFIVFGNSVKLL